MQVVEAFSCHDIDGTRYLRADYTVDCASAEWRSIAAYAAVFVVFYVALLPVAVLATLYRYRGRAAGRRVAPQGLVLGFLLDDYKLTMPCLMWDGFEMLRCGS